MDADGPVRLDGELELPDGAAVNWRELAQRGADQGDEVLVKTMDGVEVRTRATLFRTAGVAVVTAALQQASRRMPAASRITWRLLAAAALLAELETWPKPGLVSHVDSGSHTDMDATRSEPVSRQSRRFSVACTLAGAAGSGMDALREIGLEAERAMMEETSGANTHRGAIFGLGLLCAAAGVTWSGAERAKSFWNANMLGATVRRRWGPAIIRGPIPLRSHGTDALRRFGAGGARAQAAAGFPHALDVGLPALRLGRTLAPGDPEAARIQSFFALLGSTGRHQPAPSRRRHWPALRPGAGRGVS